MWEYLANYKVEMTLVRGYLRCTHQIVVLFGCVCARIVEINVRNANSKKYLKRSCALTMTTITGRRK